MKGLKSHQYVIFMCQKTPALEFQKCDFRKEDIFINKRSQNKAEKSKKVFKDGY